MSAFKALAFSTTMLTSATVGALSISSADNGCTGSYVITKGDTLLEISRAQLGSAFAVHDLIKANRSVIGHDPDLIYPGDRLTIPCAAAVKRSLDWSELPDTQALAGLLRRDHVQVLDIRATQEIKNGLIPGAIHVPFSTWTTEGPRPSEPLISDIVGLSGLKLDAPIVIVNSNPSLDDLEQSAMIYGVLQAVGGDHIAILQDGYRGWINADMPVVAFPTLQDPYEISLKYLVAPMQDPFAIFQEAKTLKASDDGGTVGPKPDKSAAFDKSRLTSLLFARSTGE